MNPPFQRIAIRGSTGSGKSTLAKALADHLQFPQTGIDNLFWQPNWTETPQEELLQKIDQFTQQPQWILEGNYTRTRHLVDPRADLLIWLDYPFFINFRQLFIRTIRRIKTKEILFANCQETFKKSFLSQDSILIWLIKTHKKNHLAAQKLRQNPPQNLQVFVFSHPKQTQAWLQKFINTPETE